MKRIICFSIIGFIIGCIISFIMIRSGSFKKDEDIWAVIAFFVTYGLFGAWVFGTIGAFIGYRKPPSKGHCQQCDYNLTGNESGVCPECGTEIKT